MLEIPRISVVMPVYNVEPYIDEAIYSILTQSYSDFEFIIINDGSIDGTLTKIKNYSDGRINLISHEVNHGLVHCLNEGISMAKGEFIARMDGDDISYPFRFQQQISYMDLNPEIGVCGGQARLSNGADTIKPLKHEEIQCWQLFNTSMIHPSVMIRKEVLNRFGICYNRLYIHAEDMHMWNELGSVTNLANFSHSLIYYRSHQFQVSQAFNSIQENSALNARIALIRSLGIEPTPEEYELHMDFCHFRIRVFETNHYLKCLAWANKLLEHNKLIQRFNQSTLNAVLSQCFNISERYFTGV